MPDREGSVDEEAVPPVVGGVVPLEVVEDKRNRGGSEEDGDEGRDKVTVVPEREPDRVQDGGDHKVPANTVNSTITGGLEPLINDEATEKSVNCRPSIVDPIGRCDIGEMLASNIFRGIGAKDAVDRGGKEPKVNDDIRNLENKVKARHDFS